jgi:hypothetical protein
VQTGSFLATHYTTDGYVPDIELDAPTAQVFLADRKITQPGVHVFDSATGARLTTSPLGTGLPPADLAVYRPAVAGVDEAAESEGMRGGAIAWAAPNPTRGETMLRFRLPGGSVSEVLVYDVRGRLVRALSESVMPEPGVPAFGWDGKNENGEDVSPGVYFYRANAGSVKPRGGRVVIVR